MGEVENGQGVGVSLTIPSIYKTENITIIRNGEQYSLPELKDNKYTFSEPGNYTVTMESINGTKSEVVFRNISPLLAPSIEYSNNKVSLVNNGTIESREATPRLEYRIGDSEWITYNNEFDLIATYGSRMIVEARAVNDEFTSDITEKNITSHALTENVLSMTLSTNTITFENFSSMQDTTKEKAVTITVSSSLGYQINAYLMSEIQNSDKSLTLNKSMLKIKESTKSSYSTFPSVGEKVVLREGNPAGEKITHDIDLLLSSGTYQVDVYKTSIKLEIEQN
jgi:hypothetical protein